MSSNDVQELFQELARLASGEDTFPGAPNQDWCLEPQSTTNCPLCCHRQTFLDMAASKEEEYGDEEHEQEIIEQQSSDHGSDRRKRIFSKELRCMMYGFGDDQNPYTESVDMLEDLVIHYITEIICHALEVGKTGRITVEDIMYIARKDPKKYGRVKDLLSMNEELKKARKAFDEVKYVAV